MQSAKFLTLARAGENIFLDIPFYFGVPDASGFVLVGDAVRIHAEIPEAGGGNLGPQTDSRKDIGLRKLQP